MLNKSGKVLPFFNIEQEKVNAVRIGALVKYFNTRNCRKKAGNPETKNPAKAGL